MDQRSPEITAEFATEKAIAAMLLELVSPKPGNVSRFQDLRTRAENGRLVGLLERMLRGRGA